MKANLERAGWKVGDAHEFLGLTPEAAFVEVKLALSDYLRSVRISHRLTQTHVARHLGSSQSRVAMMLLGEPVVLM